MKKYLIESFGTFFLTLAILMASRVNAAPGFAPLAAGSMLMAWIVAGRHISGGHYNPAVSLAALMQGKLERFDFPYYWLAQFSGGFLAALIGSFLLNCSGVAVVPARTDDPACAVLAEFLGTFALVFIALQVNSPRNNNSHSNAGPAIGFTQFAGMFVFAPISGGYFNPAVVTGLSVAGLIGWNSWWWYGAGALLGAAAAASVFRAMYGEEE